MRPFSRLRALSFAMGGLLALGIMETPAMAQKVSMATWGGGVGETWRNSFGKLFQDATGTPVTITEVPNPEAQVRAQKGAPQYNAVIATYFEAANMNKDGLIETFDVSDFPEIRNIAEKYRLLDGKGRLLGMPVYFMYYGIALNTDNAKAAELSSWSDLARPKWKGQLALNRPIYASTYDLTVLAYASGGDEKNIEPGMKLYERIAQNGMTAFSSMAQMNQLLTRGEIAGGAYYSTRVWQMKREGLTNVDFVVPKEGALMLPYLVVVPKNAPDMATAKKWLDFVGKADPQLKATEISGYMPLNETAVLPPPIEKIVGMPLAVLKPKLIQPDWSFIAEKQKERVAFIEKTIAGIK
jgi:putative spermidine/putrescine transport system substrate-binding protein